ncbi:dihydroxyacetone kinase subunit DhaK [Mycoplasma todarodis]|uniref:Dihydroxyacetone kinase subunit DhaK n=1 Tax=Mycoplasma todarodis TaxID=1937191 RepID=A0A4R0XJG3_9MOLU|nr:dihydroxyacetone kinase subunit DhaK [Mycoplasma todarodis]TCG10776.1 dihydroxyacetone kinase subunit DhaK [Mycoplasma todarodis]
MKKILNNPSGVVLEMMEGIANENKDVAIDKESQTLYKKNINKNKVSLISGGGSGHEPAHAGFIGKGMLDAAVCGEVFTSPTPDMIQGGMEKIASDKGTLLVVKNYSGDVMNFEVAKMLAEAEGQEVEMVIVNDDVAVEDSTYTTGRRGIAGTIFVHKVAGAAAERGADLGEVKRIAEKVIANTRTMGMSLGHCITPESGTPSFILKEDEMEVGLGIHGEPGIKKETVKPSKEIVKELLDYILKDIDYKDSKVALLVNGLGGTPIMELYVANKDAFDYLKEQGIEIAWNKVGNYMTSLEMPGMSLTLMKLDDELESLLNDEANAKGWN